MSDRIPYQSEWKDGSQHGTVRVILKETDTFDIIINGKSLELPFLKELLAGKEAKLSIAFQLADKGNWDNFPAITEK